MDKFTGKTSFEQWFSQISSDFLEEQIENYQLDHYVKKLYTKRFLKLLFYAQINETESLRALSDHLFSENLQKETDLGSISFSQLGRRLNKIPTEFFRSLFLKLVGDIQEKSDFNHQRKVTMPLKIIDSSTLPLNLQRYPWAEFRQTKAGAKLHLRLVFAEKGCSYPDQVTLTNAKTHDRSQLEVFVDDKSCMYVFDRGYLDYKKFDQMADEGYYFLTRLRKNAVIRSLKTIKLPENSDVISDEMIVIGSTQSRCENTFRLIKIYDNKGDVLNLITNRFDLSAKDIADMYKSRWAIELFFKWIKQHLNIKTFYGRSEQAVHNQIYAALITYCLHVLIHLETNSEKTYLRITRLLKASLWDSPHVWISAIQGKSVP